MVSESTSLWFDNWHPLGPLAEKFGNRMLYDSGLPRDSKVSAIIKNFRWKFPITQTLDLNEIRSILPTLPEPNVGADHHRWMLTPNGIHSIASMWEHLRTHFPKGPMESLLAVSWSHTQM